MSEIHVLSSFEYHPNIIQINRLNSKDWFQAYTASLGLFFLKDVLDATLDHKID